MVEACPSPLLSPPRMRLTSPCRYYCPPPQDQTKVAAFRESLQRAVRKSESGRKPGMRVILQIVLLQPSSVAKNANFARDTV